MYIDVRHECLAIYKHTREHTRTQYAFIFHYSLWQLYTLLAEKSKQGNWLDCETFIIFSQYGNNLFYEKQGTRKR